MENSQKNYFLVAGEASGDMHGANLVNSLKALNPKASFCGLGGPQMQSAGVNTYCDLTEKAVVGFWEVIKHYNEIKSIFQLALEKIDEVNPDAVILIDYPGFNLRLAKEVKNRGIKAIYYISPQVWAWKQNRIHFIKEHIDLMLVLFPFEKDLYKRHGMDVTCVGHPLIDAIKPAMTRNQFMISQGLNPEALTIGLLPGSRQKEIEKLLPVMLQAAQAINNEFSNIQFLIIKAPTIAKADIDKQLDLKPLQCTIIEDQRYDAMNACDACMVASGTATLETALLHKPMVVVYKTSLITWLLARLFIKIRNIGLVNVVAQKRIVPECVQFQATGRNIANEMIGIFTNEPKIANIKSELKLVEESLGAGGASQRAAAAICQATS